ncbi:MAG: hypothetical protein ACLFP4_16730 [Spirochaetales bacterium]
MAIPEGYTTIAAVVPRETRDKLHAIATERGISVSRLLAAWLETGVDAPIERAGKRQSVRRYKDELMISLPRDWQRRTDIAPGQRISIAYSDDALIVRI